MLRTLDLFSGIGGITLALEGIASPVAYCDWAPESRAALESLMARGMLPRAPVSDDVRSLGRRFLGGAKVDMIVGGFPCVGFSPLGLRKAFDDDESGLFREILRLADELKTPALFLENVPNVVKLGMDAIVCELTAKRGYELRWTVVAAGSMGAPHKRARWFCLALKPGFKFKLDHATRYTPFPWGDVREPPRSKVTRAHSDVDRKSMLGNSVVPDAVRYAFLYLASRCSAAPRHTLDTDPGFTIVPAVGKGGGPRDWKIAPRDWHTTGVVTVLGVVEDVAPPPVFRAQHRRRLTFDPMAFVSTKPASPLLSSDLIIEPVVQYTWATPRRSLPLTNFLTARSVRDLATQVRFERGTPKSMRKGCVTPEFVEYLMGYPPGWTDYDLR
jgi:hypothetical protein